MEVEVLEWNQQQCLISMQSLKLALGKEEEREETSVSRLGPSRMHNKSKSAAIWALDPDEDEQEIKKGENRVKNSMQTAIKSAFKKDPNFSEMSFYETVDIVQSQWPTMKQTECLITLEATVQTLAKSPDSAFGNYLEGFLDCLVRKIKKIRRKQKKHELQEFDKIVQTNFKRKGAAFIDEDHPDRKARLKADEEKMKRGPYGSNDLEGSSKKNGSSSSTEGKLGQLLSNSKVKGETKELPSSEAHEESVSFSAVISQNMTVRRRGKEPQKKEKPRHDEEKVQEGQSEGRDEAFIFYRPKIGKKK